MQYQNSDPEPQRKAAAARLPAEHPGDDLPGREEGHGVQPALESSLFF